MSFQTSPWKDSESLKPCLCPRVLENTCAMALLEQHQSHQELRPPSPAVHRTTALLNVFLNTQSVMSLEIPHISNSRLPNVCFALLLIQIPREGAQSRAAHARGMQTGSGLTWSSHSALRALPSSQSQQNTHSSGAAEPRGAGTLPGHSSPRQMGLDHSTATF